MLRLMVVAALAVGVAGCLPTRGAGERFMSEQEIEAKDDGVCRSYGAARGSPGYLQCRLSLRQNRSNESNAIANSGPLTCNTVGGVTNCF